MPDRVEGDAAGEQEPGDEFAVCVGRHRVAEALHAEDSFGRAVRVLAVAFFGVVAVVGAEAAAGGAVEWAGFLGGGLRAGPGEADGVLGAGEVDLNCVMSVRG